MLKEITRFGGLGISAQGVSTAHEAIQTERRNLRLQRFKDLKLHKSKDHVETIDIGTLESRFDEIVSAFAAADAQFEADNAKFLKKHRPDSGKAND